MALATVTARHHHAYPDLLRLELCDASDAADPPVDPMSDTIQLGLRLSIGTRRFSILQGNICLGLTGLMLNFQSNDTTLEQSLNLSLVNTDLSAADRSRMHIEPESHSLGWQLFNSATKRLQGNLEFSLGYLPGQTLDYVSVEAHFTPVDLCVIEAEGLWPPDIHPNQHAVLERLLILRAWQAEILGQGSASTSHSQIDFQTLVKDGGNAEQPIETPEVPDLTQASASDSVCSDSANDFQLQFQYHLEKVVAMPPDFAVLAQQVGLNPLTDFAGANLLAAELQGVDLCGASLWRSNLRGAALMDGDLSEADLRYARLSGADCSGTFFSGANLQGANLHRSSLALANLSGANLQGADLREANLSSTNLSSAQVKGAMFGNNVGLAGELRESLVQRGAIFEG